MTAVLTGELNADGSQIVLAASGDINDLHMIAGRLQLLTPQVKVVKDAAGNVLGSGNIAVTALTWPAVVQLGRSFGNGYGTCWRPQSRLRGWMADEAARRVMTPPPLPDGICPPHLIPRDYQREDAAAFAAAGKGMLLHDPGLGKTVIAILGIEARRRAGTGIFPMIIVVPNWDVADVWDSHIRAWAPGWPAPVMHKGANRARVRRWTHRRYILITTYATARLDSRDDSALLPGLRAATAIADEAHMIGNGDSQQSKAWQLISAHALTIGEASGTMITHNAKNIYPALKALDKKSWPSWERVRPRYIATRRSDDGYAENITGLRPEMQGEFFACLKGQLISRAKADVLPELPPKIYSVRRPEMPPGWRRAYETMEHDMLAALPDGGELPVMSILAQLTRLSQLASSAADVEVTMELNDLGIEVPHYHVTLRRPCWKAESLLGYLGEREGLPTAVFTESRQLAMLTGEYCEEAGLRCGYITGEGPRRDGGPPVTRKSRVQAREDFQAGKLDVIICTAGAGGVGITLTRASAAAMLQRSWQLDLGLQPEDRLHRIGQLADHVEITDFVTQHTIDQRRREVLRDKAGQLGQFIRDPRFVRELLGGLK